MLLKLLWLARTNFNSSSLQTQFQANVYYVHFCDEMYYFRIYHFELEKVINMQYLKCPMFAWKMSENNMYSNKWDLTLEFYSKISILLLTYRSTGNLWNVAFIFLDAFLLEKLHSCTNRKTFCDKINAALKLFPFASKNTRKSYNYVLKQYNRIKDLWNSRTGNFNDLFYGIYKYYIFISNPYWNISEI
jgi:hypothetical protein